MRLWHRHERRGDEGALETLLEYNREEVEHLPALMDVVGRRLHDAVFEAVVGSPERPERH